MPQTIIRNSSNPSQPSTRKGGETFTGDVYLDSIITDSANGLVAVHVTFTPCARTHWHTHERGQMLRVVAGSGWVCEKGGTPQRIKTGDTVWAPPGTTHWHGGDEGSYMTHLAVSLGKTSWAEAVTDEEYAAKKD